MTTITIDRATVEQALEALESVLCNPDGKCCIDGSNADRAVVDAALTALRAALAQEQAETVKKREDFGHGVGADRFKVVRGAYWWHVLIGDSTTKHGKFHTQTGAEEMAALLLREFRNGAFVQHEAAQEQAEPLTGLDMFLDPQDGLKPKRYKSKAEPVQEPVAWLAPRTVDSYSRPDLGYETCSKSDYGAFPTYTAPPQRTMVPLTEEEIFKIENDIPDDVISDRAWTICLARAVERAVWEKNHGQA